MSANHHKIDLPLTDRSLTAKSHRMQKSASAAGLDTYRRSPTRLLLPRLPSVSNVSINPRTMEDLTPTTLEACRRSGVLPKKLLPNDYSKSYYNPKSPKNKSIPKSVIELRKTFAEKDRITALKQVDFIRKKLMQQKWNPGHTENAPTMVAETTMTKKTAKPRLLLSHSHAEIGVKPSLPSPEAFKSVEILQQSQRQKKARQKQSKVNKLIGNKWRREANVAKKLVSLEKGDATIAANRRHDQYIKEIVANTRRKNAQKQLKAQNAKEKINSKLKETNAKIYRRLELTQQQIQTVERMHEKDRREFIEAQKMKYKQHRIAFRRILQRNAEYDRKRQRTVRKKHKKSVRTLDQRRTQMQTERKRKSVRMARKIKETFERKKIEEQQHAEKVYKNIQALDTRMREVEAEKVRYRQEMKKKSLLSRDRVGLVQKKVENERLSHQRRIKLKEQQTNARLRCYRQQRDEERVLRKEYSNLMKKQRIVRKERERKKDEYERTLLEKRLNERDNKIRERQLVKKQLIAQQLQYNNKVRLLREELAYKFEHCTQDEIVNPQFVEQFVHEFDDINTTNQTPAENVDK